ncbi:MAG: D-alanine--D-alanine ligase [Bacteroidota bacterium]
MRKILNHPFFIKLFHWEYWSFNIVYGPIYLYWFWLCLRARSFFFINTANPTIKNGGFLLESKKEIYGLMPSGYYPQTMLCKAGIADRILLAELDTANIGFPMIGKPDIGMRGLAVKKLESKAEVIAYAQESKVDFLLQEFVPYEKEAGIFYYRYPGERKGRISGIVGKDFLSVTGDGQATVMQLLKKDKRFILQIPALLKTHGTILDRILAKDEEFLLVPYGNHARGAKFLDISDLIDEKLTDTIDEISQQVPGFYYGRMDIRYRTWEELCQGKHFSIIELNGSGSEPTHMYDPRHSIFFAWKEIIRHWNILLKVSMLNHSRQKIPYMTTKEGLRMLRENKAYVKLIQPVNPAKPDPAMKLRDFPENVLKTAGSAA